MILGEIGDINRFSCPSKILSYAGMEAAIKQSGNFIGQSKMVKKVSKYLSFALFKAAETVSFYDNHFKEYLHKKRLEGKHYRVALSHVARKLIRVIFKLSTTGETFVSQS